MLTISSFPLMHHILSFYDRKKICRTEWMTYMYASCCLLNCYFFGGPSIGRVVDDGLQQISLAHDSIAFLLLLVIFVDVVAFLLFVIEGVVSVTFIDKFFAAVNEMFAPVVVVSNQIFAAARFVLTKLLHCFIKFDIESVLVCIVCQKSVFFRYD